MSGIQSTETETASPDPVTKETTNGVAEKQGPKCLDLAFAMDCTGSMGSYINNAQQNIHRIVDTIVSEEAADIRLALVEYRDHPPQERSFVTNVHDFTSSVRSMKKWLDACRAVGGGDQPEAVADALHQLLKLNWRAEATKVCVFIADAPPHGLGCGGDSMPNGCPDGLDPMTITNQLAEKEVCLYSVGCEPSITPFKEFFQALSHLTGGQYVPLNSAHLLAKVITGGVQEEMALQQLMEEVNQEVLAEFASTDVVAEEDITRKVHEKLKSRGAKAKKLQRNNADLPEAPVIAQQMAYCADMGSAKDMFSKHKPPVDTTPFSFGSESAYDGRRSRFSRAPTMGAAPAPSFSFLMSEAPPASMNIGVPHPSFTFGGMSAAPPPPSGPRASMSPEADDYLCAEDDVSEAQVQRMVQKSVMSNQLKGRFTTKH